MKVILFGATGMIGQGVLRECLLDPSVERVLTVGRTITGTKHEKLTELAHSNLFDFSTIERALSGYDACFFCLGVGSAGMSEEAYRHVTYDIAVSASGTLARLNPQMTFIFVSGAGSDANGRQMWQRVKGATENAILAMPFRASFVFRPAVIRPLHGIRSRTAVYRIFYALLRPGMPLLERLIPAYVTNTEKIGRAMLNAAKRGARVRVLESKDINALA
jgi:uncharacterized protein YbjT (DUF2867 family)